MSGWGWSENINLIMVREVLDEGEVEIGWCDLMIYVRN